MHNDSNQRLILLGKEENNLEPAKWKWSQIKHTGSKPNPRSGFSMITISQNRAVLFGGVIDEEDEEDVEGLFLNDMYILDMERIKWFELTLQDRVEESKDQNLIEPMESSEVPEDTVVEDGVFTLKIGRAEEMDLDEDRKMDIVEKFRPSPRMNACLATHGNILYLYGGVCEKGDVQITYNDLYSINTQKFDEWKIIIEPMKDTEVVFRIML